MSFIEEIRRYQTVGDRAAFETVRNAMTSFDFLRDGVSNLPGPEYYVAFRCLRLIGGRLATIKYTLAEYGLHTKQDTPEWIFAEYARFLRDWTGIELTVDNYPKHEEFLSDYLMASFYELRTAYERIIMERPTVWQLLTSKIIDAHWGDIVAALEYAFNRVDTSRTEREIVRYINRSIRTKYVRSQFGGLRRVRREGRTRYIEPSYFGPVYAIFGRADVDPGRLPPRQRDLYDSMVVIVEKDAAANRFEPYNVDLNGGYRIKNRYIAEKLGMHEASLSRALRRMRDFLKC